MIRTNERAKKRVAPPLEGEDVKTTHWQDARHWMNIYDELIRFKCGVAERIRLESAQLPPPAQRTALRDLASLETQISGHQDRLKLWTRRAWQLHGMWLDRSERILRHHNGRTAALTTREFELLRLLLDNPEHFYTTAQVARLAWANPRLGPEQVRNYVSRVRRLLAQMEIPCVVITRPGRGYAIVFHHENPQ
jgi:DNA-binding CsgD family transcriptional regulator